MLLLIDSKTGKMAKKKKLKFYTGTASDGVTIFITAYRRKEAQKQSNTEVLRVKVTRAGVASTVESILNNLCEPKPKKLPHAKTVNLG